MSDLWPDPPDRYAEDSAEDIAYRDIREPYEPPDPAQQHRTALARRPTPGQPVRRPTEITVCGWDPGAA